MAYCGDIRLGETHDFKFTTRNFSTGAPFTLAGSPVISAYVGNGTTEITAGITLSVDFDSRTGLNNIRVVATSGNGYATATDVDLVITTGTVNSVSVVGEVVASFSIENRSALMPTTAGRTLVVDASGLADATAVKLGPTGAATAQTARDVGASVLLSSGTGTGQLDFTSGVVKADATKINGVATSSVTTINANVGTTQPVNFTGTGASALVKSDMVDIAGAAVSTSSAQIGTNVVSYASGQAPLQPTTAGRTLDVTATGEAGIDWANIGGPTTTQNLSGTTIKAVTDAVSSNVTSINSVSTSSVTTVNANLGTTQPVNFTGTAGSALVKSDTVDIAGAAVSTSSAQIGVNVVSYASGQAPLQPTVAGRTLDVSATGEAGVDWANVGSPTTTVGLTGTTISTAQVVASVTGAVGSVTGAVGSVTGNVGGNVVGSVGSVTAGVTVTTNNDKTGYRLSATGVDDVWDEAVDGTVTARESVRLANSANGAKVSGAATTTVDIRDLADTKNRVVATVDSDGNRTAVTLDLT